MSTSFSSFLSKLVHLIHDQIKDFMRRSFLLFILFSFSILAYAQNGHNPFDLSTPSTEKEVKPPKETLKTTNNNPFNLQEKEDIQANAIEQPKLEKAVNNNPFDLSVTDNGTLDEKNKTSISTRPVPDMTSSLEEDKQNASTKQNGWILVLILFVLTVTTFVFIFFRSLYSKIYKAVFSNNQLSLLYRERQGGMVGSFFVAYGLFFLSAGLFIYLALVDLNKLPPGDVLKNYSLITIGLAAIFIAKHLLLSLIAYLFPIRKEVRIYSFTIMIFAIILGVIISFADFILAYSPEGVKMFIMYFMGLLFLLIYLLRSLRGLFIANRFVFNYFFHFLLYLCAVEIAPALVIYKMIFNFQG